MSRSIFFWGQYAGRTPFTVLAHRLGDDPELHSLAGRVGRQDATSVEQRLVVEGFVFAANVAPIASDVAPKELIGRLATGFQGLQCAGCGNALAEAELRPVKVARIDCDHDEVLSGDVFDDAPIVGVYFGEPFLAHESDDPKIGVLRPARYVVDPGEDLAGRGSFLARPASVGGQSIGSAALGAAVVHGTPKGASPARTGLVDCCESWSRYREAVEKMKKTGSIVLPSLSRLQRAGLVECGSGDRIRGNRPHCWAGLAKLNLV